MRSSALFAAAVLSTAVVSGGFLVRRGLIGGAADRSADHSAAAGARLFSEVFEHVARDYVDSLPDAALYARSVDGLIRELHDSHSAYLTPERLARLAEGTAGHYAGVGIEIDVRDGLITVVAPLPGGPAKAAGIQGGDRIVEISGQPTRGFSAEEAQRALRGAPGSRVLLKIQRPGAPGAISFMLTRREIRVQSAQDAVMLGDGVGYVNLTMFSENAAPELRRSIDSMRAVGMHALILDLRGDPGGLLDQGVAVSDLFLDAGEQIVTMRGRARDANRRYVDATAQPWPRLRLALLVDSGTASAAEIVAGALQDHDRAVLVGTTTYGKGSAQSVYALGNGGALKLTTARWFTPSGRSIGRSHLDDDDEGTNDEWDSGATVDSSGELPRGRSRRSRTFRTDAGRTVLGGGGIVPDLLLPPPPGAAAEHAFEHALDGDIPAFREAVTEYARSLESVHAVSSPAFVVTPAMRLELFRRMQRRAIPIDARTYERAAPLVDRLLGYETARYVFGEQAEVLRRLRDDAAVGAAFRVLRGARVAGERERVDRVKRTAGR
jgi:carboxyl-terminal processing protease